MNTLGLSTFQMAYIEAALWSSTDDDGNPLDSGFSVEDIDSETLQTMLDDCEAFQAENEDTLDGYDEAQAGHDFWLTRNHHGAGFWECGHCDEAQGEALTNASEALGDFELYIGDDGKIYA